MKRLFFIWMLFLTLASNAQNDYILSDRHYPIIDAVINNVPVFLIVDTGSELTIIDNRFLKQLSLRNDSVNLSAESASNNFSLIKIKNCDIKIKNRRLSNNSVSANLGYSIDLISQRTDKKIIGILGSEAIKELKMVIDLSRGIITINKVADK